MVCYNCQKTGHIKYDCPNVKVKMNQIRSPTKVYADSEIRGKVNGEKCPVKVDTGADMTAVPSRFIRKNQYTGRIYNITTSNMGKERLREARVTLEVRGITTTQTVLVIAEGAQELLLGKDHPIPQQILDTLKANPETLDKPLCAITRAESQKVARQEREDEEAEVQDGALLRTAEPDQPKPTLPNQSHAPSASNLCVYQPQAKEKVEQEKKEGEMGVEEDKDEVDWDDEDEVDWEEDGEEGVEEDLSLEGRVRGQDEVSDVPLPALAERQEGLTELRCQQERETLTRLHGKAAENEGKAKRKSKEVYDWKAKERCFTEGDMVSVHTPSISGKLETVWEGPFEVVERVSETTYKLAVPDRRSHIQTSHINRLKLRVTPQANLYRLIVADEVEEDDQPLGKVKMGETAMSMEQKVQMDGLLGGFCETVTKTMGKNVETVHTINTGEH